LFAIRVQPNQADSHIWKTIADSSANVFIVADKISSDAWIATFGKGKSEWLGDKFAGAWGKLQKYVDSAFDTVKLDDIG
jgi:hypothetical protein